MGRARGGPTVARIAQATRDGGWSTVSVARAMRNQAMRNQAMRKRWRTVMGPERMMSADVSSSPSSPNDEVT